MTGEVILNSAFPNVFCSEVFIVDDSIVEIQEVFILQLFSGDSSVLILTPNVSTTIIDNDGIFINTRMQMLDSYILFYSCSCQC